MVTKNHPHYSHFHIVMSPKELPDYHKLEQVLIKKGATDYIISHETGQNGHDHLDCFVEFSQEYRSDKLKELILKRYPEIPDEERINIKITHNSLTSDPILYGIGYAAKEHNILTKTYSDDKITTSLDFYTNNLKIVESAKIKLITPQEYKVVKSYTYNDVGKYCYAFVKDIIKDQLPTYNELYEYVQRFYEFALEDDLMSLPLYRRVPKQAMTEYVSDKLKMGSRLLTTPYPSTYIHPSTNNPLIK